MCLQAHLPPQCQMPEHHHTWANMLCIVHTLLRSSESTDTTRKTEKTTHQKHSSTFPPGKHGLNLLWKGSISLHGELISLHIYSPSKHLNYSDSDTNINFRIILSSQVNDYSNKIHLFPAVGICPKMCKNCPCTQASPSLNHEGCSSW